MGSIRENLCIKIIVIILINAFLMLDLAWAGINNLSPRVGAGTASFADDFRDLCLIQSKMNLSFTYAQKLFKRLNINKLKDSDKLYALIERDIAQGLKSLKLNPVDIKEYIRQEIEAQGLSLYVSEQLVRRKVRSIFINAIIRQIGWDKFITLDALKLMFASRNIFSKNFQLVMDELALKGKMVQNEKFYYDSNASSLQLTDSSNSIQVFESGGNADVFNLGDTVLRVRRKPNTFPDIRAVDKTLKNLSQSAIIAPIINHYFIGGIKGLQHYAVQMSRIKGQTLYEKVKTGTLDSFDVAALIKFFDRVISEGATFADYKKENIVIGKIAASEQGDHLNAYYADIGSVLRNDIGMPQIVTIMFLLSKVKSWTMDPIHERELVKYLEFCLKKCRKKYQDSRFTENILGNTPTAVITKESKRYSISRAIEQAI